MIFEKKNACMSLNPQYRAKYFFFPASITSRVMVQSAQNQLLIINNAIIIAIKCLVLVVAIVNISIDFKKAIKGYSYYA